MINSQKVTESHKPLSKNYKDFFATVNDLALLRMIISGQLSFKQNGISLIRSYGHFVTSSDKRKRNNEASDELLGEAEAALG